MSEMTVEEMAARLGLQKDADDENDLVAPDGSGIILNLEEDRYYVWPTDSMADGRPVDSLEEGVRLLYRLRFPEAEAPAVVPASKKRTNVEIVEAAWQKWKATPSRGVPIDYTIEATFAAMLAEAFVADQVEVERG